MSEPTEVDVFDIDGNIAVVKMPDRNYPGILIQGDTLSIIQTELAEIQEEIDSGDIGAAKEIAQALHSKISVYLKCYERSLESEGIELPYVK